MVSIGNPAGIRGGQIFFRLPLDHNLCVEKNSYIPRNDKLVGQTVT